MQAQHTAGDGRSVLSRRAVLVGGAGLLGLLATGCRPRPPALVGGGALPLPAGPGPGSGGPPDPEPAGPPIGSAVERSGWLPLVGATVVLRGAAGPAEAVVGEVADLPGAPAGHPTCFSVELELVGGPPPGCEVVTVARQGAAEADLLVSPVDTGRVVRRHQIVVNTPS